MKLRRLNIKPTDWSVYGLILMAWIAWSLCTTSPALAQSNGAHLEKQMKNASTSDYSQVEIHGHRGCRGLMPENSLPGFLHALELGVRELEMDVCISADGQVVLSHEPWISMEICRLAEGTRNPVKLQGESGSDSTEGQLHFGILTYSDILQYDCGSMHHPRFPQQQKIRAAKPLLQDVFDLVEPWAASKGTVVYYNIELKARPEWDGVEQPAPEQALPLLLNVITQNELLSRSFVQSFDYRVLRLARTLEPELQLVQLVEHSSNMKREWRRLGFEPQIYSPWFPLVRSRDVQQAHRRGIRIIPWTINETSDMEHMLELGVDGLITDYPDRAIELMRTP